MRVFKKDYKLLYDATKMDLADQISHTTDLEQELSKVMGELSKLRTSDTINLRERIAMRVVPWESRIAQSMFDWIVEKPPALTGAVPPKIGKKRGPKKGVKRGSYKITAKRSVRNDPLDSSVIFPKTKKRKYTKKSKFWKKKK